LVSVYLPTPGGAQVCLHNIAERHVKAGARVAVVAPFKYRKNPGYAYDVIPLWPLTVRLLTCLGALGRFLLRLQLRSIQDRHRFDLWQVTPGYPLGSAAVDFFNGQGIPAVLRCTGDDIQRRPLIGYGRRLDARVNRQVERSYPRFDAAVAISGEVEQELLSLGVDAARIHRIPNGVDLARFRKPLDRSKARARWKVGDRDSLILTVGRCHAKKGFDLLPRLIAGLAEKRTDFKWLLAGAGARELQPAVSAKGVERFLVIHEPSALGNAALEFPAEDLIEAYRAADVFVFPTRIETFGIVVVEAMAAGLPVVTTNAPGVDELVSQERTGLKSNVDDVAGMLESIVRLLSDTDLRGRLHENALRESEKYDWNSVAQGYKDVYRRLVRD
jgi:glycosyltransferase involved in cell wall biosynthesis